MSLHTDRRPRSNRVSSPELLTRWMPRPLEQLEDRLTPSVTLSNSPTWLDAGPNNITGGQTSGITGTGATNSSVSGPIQTITPDLSDLTGNTLYAGGINGGVWKTINGLSNAPTWIPLTDTFPSLSINCIAINPANNQQILAGIGGSADGLYARFGQATAGPDIALDSRGLARGDLIGALYSADGGATWKVLNNNIAGQNIVGVAIRTGYMLVAGDNGIFRSTDGGATFNAVAGGLPAGGVFDFVADPGAAVNAVVGATWAANVATITTANVHNLAIGQSVVITGVNPNGYNGTYQVTSTPTTNSFTYALATNPGPFVSGGTATANPNEDPLARSRFYAAIKGPGGVGGRGIYRTDNGGVSWFDVTDRITVNSQLIGARTTNVQIAVFNSGILSNNIVYVAVENNAPVGAEATTIGGNKYAWANRLSEVSTVTYSSNQGGNWTRMDAPRYLTQAQGANVFSDGAGLVHVTTFGGARHQLRTGDQVRIDGVRDAGNPTTTPPTPPQLIGAINNDPVFFPLWTVTYVNDFEFTLDGSNYTGTYDASPNGTWRHLNGANPGERPEFFDIAVDPTSSNFLYLGTDQPAVAFANTASGFNTYTGVYWRGDRFTPAGNGGPYSSAQWSTLTNSGAGNTAPSANSRDIVFSGNQMIAATGGGIFRRPTASGSAWKSANGNLQVADIASVGYDTLNDRYFAGTIDTQAINQTNASSSGANLAYSSVLSATDLRNNIFDQGNVFVVLADNSRLNSTGATVQQTTRYYVSSNFAEVVRNVYDNTNTLLFSETLDFVNPLLDPTDPLNRFSGLKASDQPFSNASQNIHIAMALNQNDQRRAMFGYNGLYEDSDPSGSPANTRAGTLVNDVTPPGMTGHVESILYGGKRAGFNFNQVVYMTTSTGQLWVRGEGGPVFTLINTGFTGPIFAVAGDPDDYRHIFVVQGSGSGSKILESKDFGATFTDIGDNLIGPATADGTAGPGKLTTEIRALAIFDSTGGVAIPGDLTLLAGGRGGVYRLQTSAVNTGGSWSEYGSALPNTLVQDLEIFSNKRLVAGTAGRGIWDIPDISTTVTLDTTLIVDGTAGNDIITISVDPNNSNVILVWDGTTESSFAKGTFSAIQVNGLGGADRVFVDSTVNRTTHLPIAGGNVDFVNFKITVDGGGDAGDTLTVIDEGVTTSRQVTITSNTIGAGAGDTIFNGSGRLTYTGFDLGTVDVSTGTGGDTYNITSLTPGQTILRGGAGSDTYNYAMNPATTSTLTIVETPAAGVDTLNVTGTAGNDTFAISPTQVVLGANTVDYSGLETISVSGLGGNDVFNLTTAGASATTAIRILGGTGSDSLSVAGVAGNETVGVDITSALGGGSFTGLLQPVSFSTLENIGFNGGGGTNAFAWRDRTNGNYGTPTTPETGVIYTPTDTTSGNIRVGTGTFPTVFFTNVNSSLVLNGDADGSGDRDVLTIQGFSTTGLQSGGPFNESTSADGSDTFTVNDQNVAMSNAALGALRTVSFGTYADGTPTFRMINVRGGNEAVTGDRFTATPSLRTNIVINGMNPTSGANGDRLTILSSGPTTRSRVNDPAVGPIQTRVVQTSNGASLGYLNIEQVIVTDTSPGGGGGPGGGGTGGVNTEGFYAVGSDAGTEARVQVYNRLSGTVRYDFDPFPGFMGGIRVAVGDVNGDGTQDIVVAAGPNGPPAVKVFSGADGSLLASFYAYGIGFTGGVDVAVADLNGDGYAEIITGSGPGAGPHIKVFDGFDFSQTASYYAFDATFLGGIRVAVGDTNGDGTPDLIVGAQAGAEPRVTVFDGKTNAVLQNFFAFDPSFTGGVYVASGDVNGDGFADVIIGAGTGDLPNVKVLDGRNGVELASFLANPGSVDVVGSVPFEGGVRVATVDFDGDGIDEILTSKGPGTFPILRFYKLGVGVVTQTGQLQVFGPNYASGVYVGG